MMNISEVVVSIVGEKQSEIVSSAVENFIANKPGHLVVINGSHCSGKTTLQKIFEMGNSETCLVPKCVICDSSQPDYHVQSLILNMCPKIFAFDYDDCVKGVKIDSRRLNTILMLGSVLIVTHDWDKLSSKINKDTDVIIELVTYEITPPVIIKCPYRFIDIPTGINHKKRDYTMINKMWKQCRQ